MSINLGIHVTSAWQWGRCSCTKIHLGSRARKDHIHIRKSDLRTDFQKGLCLLVRLSWAIGPIYIVWPFCEHKCRLHWTLGSFLNNFLCAEKCELWDLPHCQLVSFVAPMCMIRHRERYSSDGLPCIEICWACACVHASRDSCMVF